MRVASFKDLCMDASDALALGRFWASVLDAEFVDRGDGSARLDRIGGDPAAKAWVDPVPEPRTGKTRVHVDLRLAGAEPDALLAAGATLVRRPGADRWFVLADPDGNEFCAFPPGDGTGDGTGGGTGGGTGSGNGDLRPGVFELVVDATDPVPIATWWAGLTGGTVHEPDRGSYAWVEGAAGFPWRYWVFTRVPEPKTVKNRVHWDVDLRTTDASELVAAGAAVVREPGGDISWWVMTDPEGNEFCAFAPAG